MSRPLDGIRVVDLSNMLMAPYATQILGDMGADVIKIEAPGGDPVRGIGPQRSEGMGVIYLNCNRSKRSILLNLKQKQGLAALLELLKDADVLVYNRRPQVMERLGLSYEAVSKINPRIIYAGLFGYGQDGPYGHKPAFDDLIQGAVAVPWLYHMSNGQEPAYAPTAIVDRGVGLWAVGQINGALFHQARTGEGQRLDLPMFEMMASFVLGDHMGGETFEPALGPMGYKRLLIPDRRPFKTKDGYICVVVYTDRHWQSYFSALGRPDQVRKDPRFKNMTTRTEHISAIYEELAEELSKRTTAEWLTFFDDADIPAMPLHSLETLFEDPHLQSVGFFSTQDHPTEGKLRQMAFPAQWSATQPAPSLPAPRLGQHSVEILREIGYGSEKIEEMVKTGATIDAKGELSG